MQHLLLPFLTSLAIANSENEINTGIDGSMQDLIMTIINYAMGIAGLIAIVFIVIAGFQYITSAGNDEGSKKAVQTMTYAVIGLLIIFASYAIVNTIFTNVLPF